MIKLSSVKEKKQKEEEDEKAGKKKESPAEIRLSKDFAELSLPPRADVRFPQGKHVLSNFELDLRPDEGYFKGGRFTFTVSVPHNYPYEPPKVKCATPVFHPNIDLDGNVCLNVLREDWQPVLNLNAICYGLQLLFLDPNVDDPLNKEAAEMLRDHPEQFEQCAKRNLTGGVINGRHFPPCADRAAR